jgi:DHA2 family multidrug resistance protein
VSAAPKECAAAALAPPRHNPWAIAFTVTLATFMEVLDTSIANVALPHIAGGLSSTVDESTWILTSYLVANAMVLPLSAWASAMLGRKNFYMSCVALFTISSFMCGIAPSLTMLIVFRILQGAGGGGLQPSEQAILADTFPPEKFGMAFAIYGMAVVCAPIIGPTLGGFIVDHFNWRWIFFINVPVGIISLLLSYRMVEDPPYIKEQKKRARARMSIDYTGVGLVLVGLGCLQVVLDKGQEEDWLSSHFIVVLSVIAAVALVSFVLWEWRQTHPILDVRLFAKRSFAITGLMMFAMGLWQHGFAAALHSADSWLLRADGWDGNLARRHCGHRRHAVFGIPHHQGPNPMANRGWLCDLRLFAFPHVEHKSPCRFLHSHDVPRVSVAQPWISLRADHHDGLLRCSAGKKQSGFEHRKLGS